MSQRERQRIEDAYEHLLALNDHLQRGSIEDPLILDPVCMRLSAAIESLSRLPGERLLEVLGDDWFAIKSTHNRIAHSYSYIDPELIAATIEFDIPPVMATLRSIIDASDS